MTMIGPVNSERSDIRPFAVLTVIGLVTECRIDPSFLEEDE